MQYCTIFSSSGSEVETVQALDEDPSDSPEGTIRYNLIRGDEGKFALDDIDGVITVASGATFDYQQRSFYVLTVLRCVLGIISHSILKR